MAGHGLSNDPLQSAIAALQISDVWQHEVSGFINDDLQGAAQFPGEYEVLFKHLVARTLWGTVDDEDDGPYVFRVHIVVGLRFIEPRNTKKPDSLRKSGDGNPAEESAENTEDAAILAQIEATYVAEYQTETDPGPEALKEFAFTNASYHVWPFWREYLASQCTRMNLPKVSVPLQTIPQQSDR